MARHEDKELAELLSKFVCVRIVQGWGIDLTLFQFDYGLTFCAFFLNADRTIYGRYGTRVSEDASTHISLDGFKKALDGALVLHGRYSANQVDFAGKTGPAPTWKTPEAIPDVKGKPGVKPADGTRNGCVHCHAVDEQIWSLRSAGQPVPESLIRCFPMPDVIGFTLDPKERATVTAVTAGSPAEKAGLKAGDRIAWMNGQVILSIADVQWVLQQAKESDEIKISLDRNGTRPQVTLALPPGWRQSVPFGWRIFSWGMRHQLMGTEPLKELPADERKTLGVADGAMALRVKGLPPGWVKTANPDGKQFKAGDVVVAVDDRNDLRTEDDLLAYLMLKKPAGAKAVVTVLRGGEKQKIELAMP